jgi:UTP--glucose-1-phosphate uridylyltransferase
MNAYRSTKAFVSNWISSRNEIDVSKVTMITKVVIPAAGAGTRLLPATKQQPKEMLPVFATGARGQMCVKPLIQLVFEGLYRVGFRQFCFVVGREKRSIEDQFTLDRGFIDYLQEHMKHAQVSEMQEFYSKVRSSSIMFVNQAEPAGFGDAVLRAKTFTGEEPFMVHAGDDFIMSPTGGYCKRLMKAFEAYDADAVFCVQKVANPQRYGVIEGKNVTANVYRVRGIEEKPKRPKSNIAIVGIYIFKPTIHDCLEKIRGGKNREIELTYAIQKLAEGGGRVYAVELGSDETRIDVGTPESYWTALEATRGRLGTRRR